MSRVKNILVTDVETFQEKLVKELINNQISYVQIENEFHFLEHIYRIYDLEVVADLPLEQYIHFQEIVFEESNFDTFDSSSFTKITEQYAPQLDFKQNKFDFCKDNYIPKINKQLIKQRNRQANKIINRNI